MALCGGLAMLHSVDFRLCLCARASLNSPLQDTGSHKTDYRVLVIETGTKRLLEKHVYDATAGESAHEAGVGQRYVCCLLYDTHMRGVCQVVAFLCAIVRCEATAHVPHERTRLISMHVFSDHSLCLKIATRSPSSIGACFVTGSVCAFSRATFSDEHVRAVSGMRVFIHCESLRFGFVYEMCA